MANGPKQSKIPQFITLSPFPTTALFNFWQKFFHRFEYKSITSIIDVKTFHYTAWLKSLHDVFQAQLPEKKIRYVPFQVDLNSKELNMTFAKISEISRGKNMAKDKRKNITLLSFSYIFIWYAGPMPRNTGSSH